MSELKIDLTTTAFNLDCTLCCGQVFRWIRDHNDWYGVIGERVIKIRQEHHRLLYQTNIKDSAPSFIERYFRFDDDLSTILQRIEKDEHISVAIRALFGLRLIRQEPWECLISYLCATYANIPRIKDMIERLSRMFGEKIRFDGKTFYTFPTKKALARASLKDLVNCKLGYRAKTVLNIAQLINENTFNLKTLNKLTYDAGRDRLLSLKGVGLKVADCVLLFSQDHLDAFPVDVWVKRIIITYYYHHVSKPQISIKEKQSLSNRRLSAFGRQYFGRYAGYAQEYLYSYYKDRMK